MDNPVINTQRDSVPDWARENTTDGEPPATQKQLDYIRSLSTTKVLTSLEPEQRASLQQPEEFWHEETTRLSKKKAGRILDVLIPLPNRPTEGYEPTTQMKDRLAVGVPAGRYAVEAESGELRFYKVWVSRDGKRLNVYVEHGPDESELRYHKTQLTILNKIKAYGVREAAIRYGMEIGSCSNCGRRLTNRISRELGIGPVCGGRMFGDDFKVDVKIKRAEIKARGENPDEELGDA